MLRSVPAWDERRTGRKGVSRPAHWTFASRYDAVPEERARLGSSGRAVAGAATRSFAPALVRPRPCRPYWRDRSTIPISFPRTSRLRAGRGPPVTPGGAQRDGPIGLREQLSSLQGLLALSSLMTESGDERSIFDLTAKTLPSLVGLLLFSVYLLHV